MPLTTGVPIVATYPTNASITKIQLDAVKNNVSAALTKTGKTYTWTTWSGTAVGSVVTAAMMNELKAATNVAADGFLSICSTHNSVVNTHNTVCTSN